MLCMSSPSAIVEILISSGEGRSASDPHADGIAFSPRPGVAQRDKRGRFTGNRKRPLMPPPQEICLQAANQQEDNEDWQYWSDLNKKRLADAEARKAKASATRAEKAVGI